MKPRLITLLLVLGQVWTETMAANFEPQGKDSASIRVAIERCQRGATLRLPAGTFDLSEPIPMKSGIRLLGAGQDETILICSGDRPMPFISLSDCEDVEMAHLTLDGRLRPVGQDGIRAGNSRQLFLHHLTIRNLAKGKSSFVHAILFSGHNPTRERGVTEKVSVNGIDIFVIQGVPSISGPSLGHAETANGSDLPPCLCRVAPHPSSPSPSCALIIWRPALL